MIQDITKQVDVNIFYNSDLVKMRSWRTTLQPVIEDSSPDIEDNITYTSI